MLGGDRARYGAEMGRTWGVGNGTYWRSGIRGPLADLYGLGRPGEETR